MRWWHFFIRTSKLHFLILLLVLAENRSDATSEPEHKVHDFKYFCERHPLSTGGSYTKGIGDTPSTCSIIFPFNLHGDKKKMRQLCRFMSLSDQTKEPIQSDQHVKCTYVSFSSCSPLPGNDRPTLIRNRCVISRGTSNKNELIVCPPGWSIPRAADIRIIYFAPLIMDVPPSAYVNAEVSDGGENVDLENDYCQYGWSQYKEPGEKIKCFKAFPFEKDDGVIKHIDFDEAKDICIGHHGWLATAYGENKEKFVSEIARSLPNGGFIGGYDTNFDYREDDKNPKWFWVDGTAINNSRILNSNSEGCVKSNGWSLYETPCNGKGLGGYVCERPGNLFIAPAVIQLHNDDYWGSRFGKIIRVDQAVRPGMICVKYANMEESGRKSQMNASCSFMESMGHTVVHENGLCFIMLNVVSVSQKVEQMHQMCYDVQDSSSRQPRYVNMNTLTRKVAIEKLLNLTKQAFMKIDGKRTVDAFLMMAAVTNERTKAKKCNVTERTDGWLADVQDAYGFSSEKWLYDARWYSNVLYKLTHWIPYRKWRKGIKDKINQIGERITVEMWRISTDEESIITHWPRNECNDGKTGRTTVVAGTEGLEDQPYYFRAPVACSFGARQYLINTRCEVGWTRHVRETGETVCIKTFNVGGSLLKDITLGSMEHEWALNECVKHNSSLASIKSYDEWKIIASLTHDTAKVNFGDVGNWYWIGARNKERYTNKTLSFYGFYWEDDNSTMGFNYLEHGEKMRHHPLFDYGAGDCIAVSNDYRSKTGSPLSKLMRWYTRSCSDSYGKYFGYNSAFFAGYVCSKKAVFV